MKNNDELDFTPWEEIKLKLDADLEEIESKKFKKQFKKIKKQLRKDIKNFQPWDYDYLLVLMEHSLEAMYLFLSNKYLIMQNTEWVDKNDPNNNWKVYTAKLKECYELIRTRNDNIDITYKNVKKAFNIMANYITYWWD